MPDGKDKKGQQGGYITDPALLSEIEKAAQPKPASGGGYITDPGLLSEIEQVKSTTVQTPAATVQQTTVTAQPEEEPFIGITPARKEQRSAFEQKLVPEMRAATPTPAAQPQRASQERPMEVATGAQFPAPTNVTTETGEVIVNQPRKSGKQVLTEDLQRTIANLPDWAKDNFDRLGVSTVDFAEKVTNPSGNTEELKQYMKVRTPMIDAKYEEQKAEIDRQYPLQTRVLSAGSGTTSRYREDEAGYNQKMAELNQQRQQEQNDLAKATFELASEKVVNDFINRGVDVSKITPSEIGSAVERIVKGNDDEIDRDARIYRKYGQVDPTAKVNRELQGYQALEVVRQNAINSGNTQLAEYIQPITNNYQQKVLANNPEFTKTQKAAALRNQIGKEYHSLWNSFAGVDVDEAKIKKAATELGWSDADIKGITPQDVKDIPGALRQFGSAFVENTAAPAAEFTWKHLGIQPALVKAGMVDKDKADKLFEKPWYDSSWVGQALLSEDVASRQLFEGESKIQTNKRDNDFLMNVSNDKAGDWNVSGASLADAAFSGAGQTAAFAAGAGAGGALFRGAKIINNVNRAREAGFILSNVITSYDNNYRDASQDIPDDAPNAEQNRVANAMWRTGVQIATERILPDYKIADMFATPTGRTMIREISQKGLGALDKATAVNGIKKMLAETATGMGQEASEESIGAAANAAGDFLFAPEKFEKTNYTREIVQSGVLGAVSSILPVAGGNIAQYRNHGPMAKSLLYDVGKNADMYKEGINADIQSGAITQEQGNAQIKTVNTLANIVTNSVPETSVVNNRKLTETQKQDYADLRLQESIINEKKTQVQDPVQSKYFDQQLAQIQQEKENILATAGIQTPEQKEAARQARAAATQQEREAEKQRQIQLNADANARADAAAQGSAIEAAPAAAESSAAPTVAATTTAVDNMGFEEEVDEETPAAPTDPYEGLSGMDTLIPLGMEADKVENWVRANIGANDISDPDKQKLSDWLRARGLQAPGMVEPAAAAPETQVAEEVATEAAPVAEDVITVGDLIEKPVMYQGQRGTISQDGQALIVKIDGTNREYELGNVDEVSAMSIRDFDGLDQQTNVVSINADNNNIVVRGTEYVNTNTDPLAAVNRDAEGNIQSVALQTADGKSRTFRGDVAEDIAYQLTLQKLEQDGNAAFEDYLNNRDDNADIRREVNDARLSTAAEGAATGDNVPVRDRAKRRQRRQRGRTPAKPATVPRPKAPGDVAPATATVVATPDATTADVTAAAVAATEPGQPEPGVAEQPERVLQRGEFKSLDYTTKDGKYRITTFDPNPVYVAKNRFTGQPRIDKRTGQPLKKRRKSRPGLYVTNIDTGEKLTGRHNKNVILQAAMEHDFTSGEYGDPMPDDEFFGSYEADIMARIKATANPIELIRLWNEANKGVAATSVLDYKEQMIGEMALGDKYSLESLAKYFPPDRKKLKDNYSFYRDWVSKVDGEGASLDQRAFEIEGRWNIPVEEQDIVDFIERFPNKQDAKRAMEEVNQVAEEAADKFSDITGFPLTNEIANIAMQQEYLQTLTPEEIDFINKTYGTRAEIEDEFSRAAKEGRITIPYEDVNIPGAEVQGATEAAQGAGTEAGRGFQLDTTKPLSEQLVDLDTRLKALNAKAKDALTKVGKRGDPESSQREQDLRDIRRDRNRIQNLYDKTAGEIRAEDWRKKKKQEQQPGQLDANGNPIPVKASILGITDIKVYNTAIEIAAKALEAGVSIRYAVQQAVDYVNSKIVTPWDERKFRDDVLRESDPTPITADEARAAKKPESGMGAKNTQAAQLLIDEVNNGTSTLADVLARLNRTNLSPGVKTKIEKYIRQQTGTASKAAGDAYAQQLLNSNAGNHAAAMQQLENETNAALAAAQNATERETINQRHIATQTALDRERLNEGIRNGTVDQATQFDQTQGQATSFQLPSQTWAQRQRQKKIDRFSRLRQAEEAAPDKVPSAVDAYRLSRSKAWAKINDVKEYLGDTVYKKGSLLNRLKKAGISVKDFGAYLYAKHAPERNAKNARDRQQIFDDKVIELRNGIANATTQERKDKLTDELNKILDQKDPNYLLMPDGGSGMTDQDAQDILDEINRTGKMAEYEAFEQEFRDNVVNKILDFKYESSMLTDEEYNQLATAYDNYVPLKIDIDKIFPQLDQDKDKPKGITQSGRDLFRSTGSKEADFNRRHNPLLQAIQDLDYSIMKGAENLANIRMADMIEANPDPAVWEVRRAQYDNKGEEIHKPKDGIEFWREGKKSYIVFNDPGLKRMTEVVKPGPMLKFMYGISAVIRTTATLANPGFLAINPLIDMQDAALYLRGEDSKEIVKNYRKNLGIKAGVLPTAYPKIIGQMLSGKGEWGQAYKDWQAQGGEVSFLSKISLPEQAQKTLKTFESYDKPLSPAQAKRLWGSMKHVANVLEAATRVVVYKSARDAGVSNEKSALMSRDATIDFEKSGTQGAYINAWKAFANASIQGADVMGKLIKNRTVQAAVGIATVAGMAQAFMADMMIDCEDNPEDCYWEMPEYKKQRSFILPTPGKIYTFPMGRKLGWPSYVGQQMYGLLKGFDTNFEQGESPASFASNVARSFLDYYNVGGDSPIEQQVVGNLAPLVSLMTNEKAFGSKVRPANKQELPAHLSYFPNTNEVWIDIANKMSAATGGGDAATGKIEISPNTMQFLFESMTTGLGQFSAGMFEQGQRVMKGEEFQPGKTPILNKFIPESKMWKTKEKKDELVQLANQRELTDEEYGQIETYLEQLLQSGSIDEEQVDRTMDHVDRVQRTTIKRFEEFDENEAERLREKDEGE